eukprot:SAG25_NODE_83_length_16558_cov_10.239307_3_plen_220_part_00
MSGTQAAGTPRTAVAALAAAGAVGAVAWCVWRGRCNASAEVRAEAAARQAGCAEALQRYGVSATRGFMPDECLARLPPEYDAWEALVDELVPLNQGGQLRAAVDALPLHSTATTAGAAAAPLRLEGLRTDAERRRACWVLGALATSYLNGPNVPWERSLPSVAPSSSSASSSTPDPAPGARGAWVVKQHHSATYPSRPPFPPPLSPRPLRGTCARVPAL